MKQEAEFAKLLTWAYRGEISGEVLFETLAEAFGGAHRVKLALLRDLEREMSTALAPLLSRYGVTGGDDLRSHITGRENAERMAALSWSNFLRRFAPVTDDAISRYRRLAALCPDEDQPILRLLIAHEDALRDFAETELKGTGDSSLDSVNEVLRSLRAHRTEARS